MTPDPSRAEQAGPRLLLNEMWTAEIARQLRARGVDAIAATEHPHRYRGIPDGLFFERAQADGRTVVTDNVGDFTRIASLAESRGEAHHGVVFALRPAFDRSRPGVVGEMVRALSGLATSSAPLDGRVTFLRPPATP